MNRIKRIREIEIALESLLKQDLLPTVKKQRLYFLNELEELLKRLETRALAVNSEHKLLPVISEELKSIRRIIEGKKDATLADVYLNAVKKHTMDLAPQVVISQNEDRFRTLESDSPAVKLGKIFKRGIRSVGTFGNGFSNFLRKSLDKPTKAYRTWIQKIPLQRLAEYHLSDIEDIITEWINNDHRLITSAIIELEEYLAGDFSDKKFCSGQESGTDSFTDLIEQLLDRLRKEKTELDKQLDNDFELIKQNLFYNLERADTLERSVQFYGQAKVEKKAAGIRTVLSNYLGRWNDVCLHLLDRTQTVEEFLSFQKELEEKSTAFIASLDSFFEKYLFEPFRSLKSDLEGVYNKLRQLEKKQEGSAAADFLNDSKGLLKKFIEEIRNELKSTIEGTELSLKANLFAENALLKANEISEHGLFVYDMELEKTPPVLDQKIIEWRLLLIRGLKEQIFNQLQPSRQHYEDFLVQIDAELEEVQQVVEVNLESAIELFGKSGKENNPHEIAIEALERTQSKLEIGIKEVREKQEALKLAVLEGGDEFCDKIMQLIHEGDSKELQILDAKYRVKEKTQDWRTKAAARWARIQDALTLFGRFGWKKAKKYVTAVSTFLGFKDFEVEQVERADVASYLSETDAKVKELPYIYRRLFNFDMEADRRFYVPLNESFGYLNKAFDSWKNEFPATFAVVGEKGSGKSTYFNYAIDESFVGFELKKISLVGAYQSEADFIRFMKTEFGLEDVNSVDEVISAIRKGKKKKVVVIESLQNFYLRYINGYGALESLLYVISETKDTVFWMVSCSLYAWAFMDKTISIAQYFSHVIRTDTLDKQQIESVIMNRHRSSGYELVFEPSKSQSKSRAYRKLMDNEEEAREYLRKAYFEDLTELSDGNASIAMIFWIRSIREFDDTHFYIKPLEVTSLEMIQELKPDVLFTLATIVLHDMVTPEELSKILLFTEQESRLMLIRLKSRGLLQQSGERYYVNQLMYRQIVRTLKEKNIIHLV